MGVLQGFDDLRPRKIIDGRIVAASTSPEVPPMEMELYVGPSGHIFAKPVPPPQIDQVGDKEKTPGLRRHQGVDQL